jgi:hypothetical protein
MPLFAQVRVTIANCELALARKDIQGALKMLRVIPRDSPHYLRGKVSRARSPTNFTFFALWMCIVICLF